MFITVKTARVKMVSKVIFVVVVNFVGTLAIPTPETEAVDIHAKVFPELTIPDPQVIDFHSQLEVSRIGGTVATDGSAPYMVALSTGWIFRNLMCGGSLISERHVLTAAHCVDFLYIFGSLSRSLRITVGTNRWNRGGLMYSVARNVTHQHYLPSVIKNDIALLVTKSKVHLSQQVVPVALSYEFVDAGVAARATGWGRIKYMGSLSDKLLELAVETIDGQQCVDAVASAAAELGVIAPPVDLKLELCTFHSPGHGMCNGDSGSALVRNDSGEQIGVVSWGLPCAVGAPDVFLRISAFKDWIQQNINV